MHYEVVVQGAHGGVCGLQVLGGRAGLRLGAGDEVDGVNKMDLSSPILALMICMYR